MAAQHSSETDIDQPQVYYQVARAIEYLSRHRESQPSLADIAAHVGLSQFHLQRVFSAWAGVSPKQYLQYITKEYAKQRLQCENVFDAALASGLSGAGRLHDLMLNWEAMTPGEYKQQGRGITIQYGSHPSPFGQCLIATTSRGICKMAFFDTPIEQQQLINQLHEEWANANIKESERHARAIAKRIFQGDKSADTPLKLLLKGSPFQIKVWEALLAIPTGELCAYQQVADRIDAPSSTRAVASAIAKNHIGYLIPCHRVIRSNGDINQYRWGATRKKAIIGWEATQRHSASP